MPVSAIFFPVEVAITLTAIVYFLNNVFKLILVGKFSGKGVVLRFGIPAIIFAFIGASTLLLLSGLEPLAVYQLFGTSFETTPIKVVIALLLMVFSIAELTPGLAKASFDRKYLHFGGALSGFIGGLSGNQGALRSPLLIKAGLSKESYIATGVAVSCLVDVARLSVYGIHFSKAAGDRACPCSLRQPHPHSSFGAFFGSRLIRKVIMRSIQVLVAVMLLGIALGLGLGLI